MASHSIVVLIKVKIMLLLSDSTDFGKKFHNFPQLKKHMVWISYRLDGGM